MKTIKLLTILSLAVAYAIVMGAILSRGFQTAETAHGSTHLVEEETTFYCWERVTNLPPEFARWSNKVDAIYLPAVKRFRK